MAAREGGREKENLSNQDLFQIRGKQEKVGVQLEGDFHHVLSMGLTSKKPMQTKKNLENRKKNHKKQILNQCT